MLLSSEVQPQQLEVQQTAPCNKHEMSPLDIQQMRIRVVLAVNWLCTTGNNQIQKCLSESTMPGVRHSYGVASAGSSCPFHPPTLREPP